MENTQVVAVQHRQTVGKAVGEAVGESVGD